MMQQKIAVNFKLKYSNFNLDIDLTLPGRGVTAFFGHSGSGKTTLLRCIAGLIRAEGKLEVNGETWQDKDTFIPVHQRPMGYVFQDANLFPHLNVLKNLQYGMKRVASNGLQSSLEEAIDLLGIEHLLERKPERLSGGERQRVAIARALAVQPKILLMDEPLASLDLARKKEILPFLERLHDQLKIPVFYVTHSPDEVAKLADHLLVLDNGKAIANGHLTDVLARLDLPIQLGEDIGVVLEATISEIDKQWKLASASFPGDKLWVTDLGFKQGQAVRLRILARDISLSLTKQTGTSILNRLPATIIELIEGDHPSVQLVRLQIGESFVISRLTTRSLVSMQLEVGKSVWVQIKSVAIIE